MPSTAQEIQAGQAVYNQRTLRMYDFIVLGVSNRLIWRCPTPRQVDHYDKHVSANHLDVGVGSGYFLDNCHFPVESPRLVLMDLNKHSLEFTAERIRRFHPQSVCCNVLSPIDYSDQPFDSIGVNYLLHCLPGSMKDKSVAFDHLSEHLAAGGCLFGATILHQGVKRSLAARWLMRFYNGRGIFSNEQDSLEDLSSALHCRFRHVHIDIVGCVALFSAYKNRQTT